MATPSKTRIDHLGARLRRGSIAESDLRELDAYRRSFGQAYAIVVRTIRRRLDLEPTGRPAKSTSSLIEKLRRESIRLTQVQDIAGCRIVVAGVAEQERALSSLRSLFPSASVIDRRQHPSHGYRAVHMVAQMSGRLIEIQIRTALQHLWAEFSEKLADTIDPAIKYGAGPAIHRELLTATSDVVAVFEKAETRVVSEVATFSGGSHEQVDGKRAERQAKLDEAKACIREAFKLFISSVEDMAGEES
jgi:putative GTP pyrophosphokinase